MVGSAGSGVGTVASVCTCTVCESCAASGTIGGSTCVPTGICTVEITTTDQLAGFGAGTVVLDVTCIACASSGDGLGQNGWLCASTGHCTGEITTIIACTASTNGAGGPTVASVSTDTGCASCTGTTRGTGARCARIGICGGRITTTNDLAGSGANTDGLGVICTDCELSAGGMASAGTTCAVTGISGVATTTTTACMDGPDGPGEDTVVLDSTCTAIEFCGETTRDIGGVCGLIGTSGGATTTTVAQDGAGAGTGEFTAISTACES